MEDAVLASQSKGLILMEIAEKAEVTDEQERPAVDDLLVEFVFDRFIAEQLGVFEVRHLLTEGDSVSFLPVGGSSHRRSR